jgi:hypothetical protein
MKKAAPASDKARRAAGPSRTQQIDHIVDAAFPASRINSAHETYGNRALGKLLSAGVIQTALKIGQPNDVYEQEADRVADQVMRMPDEAISTQRSAISKGNNTIQVKPG